MKKTFVDNFDCCMLNFLSLIRTLASAALGLSFLFASRIGLLYIIEDNPEHLLCNEWESRKNSCFLRNLSFRM
jgi:hypothetical protein